jgi:hypothetical protein
MALSAEKLQLILDRLKERVPVLAPCALCGQKAGYSLGIGMFFLVFQDNADALQLSGTGPEPVNRFETPRGINY